MGLTGDACAQLVAIRQLECKGGPRVCEPGQKGDPVPAADVCAFLDKCVTLNSYEISVSFLFFFFKEKLV